MPESAKLFYAGASPVRNSNRDGSEYVSSAQTWLREKSFYDDQDLFAKLAEID